jgi:uncharacterized repeat protein (TIGR01451 family)
VAATTNASTTAVITASGACTISGNTVTMTSGTGTCSLTATWASDANYIPMSLSQSTTATMNAPSPAVTVAKSVTSTGPYNAVGQNTVYQFVVTNTGNVTLNSVGVSDTQTAPAGALNSGPNCQSLSSPAGSCVGSTTTLSPGQSRYVSDSATAQGIAPIGSAVTSPPSIATVTVTSLPAVSLVKSASITSYSASGTLFTYYFKITNTGNVMLNPVTVTDSHAGLSAIAPLPHWHWLPQRRALPLTSPRRPT